MPIRKLLVPRHVPKPKTPRRRQKHQAILRIVPELVVEKPVNPLHLQIPNRSRRFRVPAQEHCRVSTRVLVTDVVARVVCCGPLADRQRVQQEVFESLRFFRVPVDGAAEDFLFPGRAELGQVVGAEEGVVIPFRVEVKGAERVVS